MDSIGLQINERVALRKPHPCGGYEWLVMRVGADIGLKCVRCGRQVMLTRAEFNKRLKKRLTLSDVPDESGKDS
jgi:hypothetical protein